MKFLDYFEDYFEMYICIVILVEYINLKDIQCSDLDFQLSVLKFKENKLNICFECWCYFYNDCDFVCDFFYIDVYDFKGDYGLEYDVSIDVEFDKDKKLQ